MATFLGARRKNPFLDARRGVLRLDFAGGDFYDAPLALLLVAFQRPETKFDGLDALKAAGRGAEHLLTTIPRRASRGSSLLTPIPRRASRDA